LKTVRSHGRVNLAGQAPSRAAHILMIIVRDAGSVLAFSSSPTGYSA
jgi:hypothetical protein